MCATELLVLKSVRGFAFEKKDYETSIARAAVPVLFSTVKVPVWLWATATSSESDITALGTFAPRLMQTAKRLLATP